MRLSKVVTLLLAGLLAFSSVNSVAAPSKVKPKIGLSLKQKYLAAKAAKEREKYHPTQSRSLKEYHKKTARKHYQTGVASFYANMFNGRLTANGERFSNAKMTAAHRTLPFGTMVEVTNVRNGRSVIVRINDRGPYVKPRVIDLSRAAAQKIGMYNSGVAKVKIAVLGQGLKPKKANDTNNLYALNTD